jgi:uncharacterized protein
MMAFVSESMKISFATARRLALHCQGLDGSWQTPVQGVFEPLSSGKEGAAQVVERLGYVQIDTIHIIQRAHHHVIWSRFPDYGPEMLHSLLSQDRRVFEGWAHAAAYLPMADFRFDAARRGEGILWPGQESWLQEHQEVVDHVLARIREEGALGTGDFAVPEGFVGGSWWSGWKPAKRALEVLFDTGELMVSERRNFQRLYDLRERIAPNGGVYVKPDRDETDDFIIRRSVGSLGVLPLGEIRWWTRQRPSTESLERLVESGLVTPVELAGADGESWYAWTAALEAVGNSPPANAASRLHILSPFDNLIIRRQWMERLFQGFNYRLECYLPQAKRQYGYFCLPILWGDRFIARVDAKADRKPRTLILRRLVFEPEFDAYDEVLPLLAKRLADFARFNDCDTVAVELVEPSKVTGEVVAACCHHGL